MGGILSLWMKPVTFEVFSFLYGNLMLRGFEGASRGRARGL